MSNHTLLYNKTSPSSFLNWLELQERISDDFTLNFSNYQKYIKDWVKNKNEKEPISSSFYTQLYIDLLKEITLNFSTEEEKRFIVNFDYNNLDNLDIILPFFIEKLKGICLFYKNKRELLKEANALLPYKGTSFNVKKIIKKLILENVESGLAGKEGEGRVTFPTLSAVSKNLQVKIEELYDSSSYFNKSNNNSFYSISSYGNLNIDKNLYVDFKQAIIEATKQYPLFLSSISNFTVNYNLTGIDLSYLRPRDFINYIQTLSSEDLKINVKRILSPKYVSSDFYYLSVGNTIDEVLTGTLFSTRPLTGSNVQNLTNRDYSTIAAVQSLDHLYTAYELGKFFIPSKSGVLQYNSFHKNYSINYEKLSPNTFYIFPDPSVVESGNDNNAIIYKSDLSWNKEKMGSGFNFGDVISDNYFHRFYAYQSLSQDIGTQPYGLSLVVDNIDFWNGEKDNLWTEESLWPGLKQIETLPIETRIKTLLFDEGTLVNWHTDIYGNEFGLYKKVAPEESVYDKKNTIGGSLYVKNTVTKLVSSFDHFFNILLLKYPENVRKDLSDLYLSFFMVKNVFVLETKNFVIVDSYEFDFNNGSFINTMLPGIFLKKSETNPFIEKFINCYYIEKDNGLYLCFLKLLPSLSATNYKSIYPVIYKLDVDTLKLEQRYPANVFDTTIYSLSSKTFDNFPEIDIRYIDSGKFLFKEKYDLFNLCYYAFNINDIPYFVNEQFTINEGNTKFTSYQPLLNKPYYYVHDANFQNPNVDHTIRYGASYSELVGSKDNVTFNWNVEKTVNDNSHFCSKINPVFINIPGTHYIQFDWEQYLSGNVFIGCTNILVSRLNEANTIQFTDGVTPSVVIDEDEKWFRIKDYSFNNKTFTLSALRPKNTNFSVLKFNITNSYPFTGVFCDNLFSVYRKVKIVKAGDGEGEVTGDPFCLDCGNVCEFLYPLYNTITLIPSASNKSVFTGWIGGTCGGFAGSCNLTITENTTITAIFTKIKEYKLELRSNLPNTTVNTTDNRLFCSSVCTSIYEEGAVVGVSASAPPLGYQFLGFEGGDCGSNNPCGVFMNRNYSLTAVYLSANNEIEISKVFENTKLGTLMGTFNDFPVNLMVSGYPESRFLLYNKGATDIGTVFCSLSPTLPIKGTANFIASRGTTVSISAIVDSPYVFKNFNGSPCETSITNFCNFESTKNYNITANFEFPRYTVTVLNSGDGLYFTYDEDFKINCGTLSFRNIRNSCTASYMSGSIVRISAFSPYWPGAGIFGLSGAADIGVSSTPGEANGDRVLSIELPMTKNYTVTAQGLMADYRTLTVIKSGSPDVINSEVIINLPGIETIVLPPGTLSASYIRPRWLEFEIYPTIIPEFHRYLYTRGYSGLYMKYYAGQGFSILDPVLSPPMSATLYNDIDSFINTDPGIFIEPNNSPYYTKLTTSLINVDTKETYMTLIDTCTAIVLFEEIKYLAKEENGVDPVKTENELFIYTNE